MSELAVGSLSGLAANSYVIDVASGSQLTQPGMVLQVVSTTKTDTFSTTTTNSFTSVTGLSATITPSSTGSKILVIVSLVLGNSSTRTISARLVRGSTPIGISTAGGTPEGNFTADIADSTDFEIGSINHLDSPSTTSSTTYGIEIYSSGDTAYVNRRGVSTAFAGSSSITLMEVAG